MRKQTFMGLGALGLALMILVPAKPSQALTLRVPEKVLSSWLNLLNSRQRVLGEHIYSTPPPTGTYTPPPTGTYTPPPTGTYTPPPDGQYTPPPGGYPTPPPDGQYTPPPGGYPPYPTCPPEGPCPSMPPGGQPYPTCPPEGPCPSMPPGGQPGPFDQNRQQGHNQEQREGYTRDMQRGAREMGSQLLRLERQFAQAAKKGVAIPQEMKDKLAAAKTIVESMKATTGAEDAQNVDMEQLNGLMQELQQFWQEYIQGQEQLQGMQRGMRSLFSGLGMFERQVVKLEKQGVNVSEIKEKIAKLKTIVTAIRAAKTFEEAQSAGLEELQELMNEIDRSRQTLEMLAHWPRMEKQMALELNRLNKAAARDKRIVDRLAKKDIDLSEHYNSFVAAIAKLKAVKEEVSANIKTASGDDIQAILENVEENFFGQMEETWQYDQVIKIMGNISSFSGEFNRNYRQAQAIIRALDRKKEVDTTELKAILEESKTRAEAVKALIKAKPLDVDAVREALEALESTRVDFYNKLEELTGEGSVSVPEGPKQFEVERYNDLFDQNDFSQFSRKSAEPSAPAQ